MTYQKNCKRCNKSFKSEAATKQYCPPCKKIQRTESRARVYQKRKRLAKKSQGITQLKNVKKTKDLNKQDLNNMKILEEALIKSEEEAENEMRAVREKVIQDNKRITLTLTVGDLNRFMRILKDNNLIEN